MPLIRGNHSFDNHFTQIPNAWLRDARLSYKARGLLAELLSHAPGFQVSRDRLARLGRDGKDAISSAIDELERNGYLKRFQQRNPNGTLASTLWVTQDPGTSENTGDEPSTGFPPTAKPTTANPHLKNTEVKNTEVKNTKTLPHATRAGEFEEEFESFWEAYPRKTDKLAARKAFEKAYAQYGSIVIGGALALAEDPNLPEKRYIPYPASWLNAGGWENEPYPPRERSKDELEARERDRIDRRNRLEREHSERIAREAQEARENASPPPPCRHGKTIVSCLTCAKELAEAETTEN